MTAMDITLTVDPHGLSGYSDKYLAAVWHAIQHASGPFGDPDLEDLAEKVGREIIRRWLRGVEPELWHRQGRHVDSARPSTLRYVPPPGTKGVMDGGSHPDWHYGTYEPLPAEAIAANVAKFNTDRQAVLAGRRARRGEPAAEEAQRGDAPTLPCPPPPTAAAEAGRREALLAEAARRAQARQTAGQDEETQR